MRGLRARRADIVLVVIAVLTAVSCSGGGCGGCTAIEPIPGGFPAAQRTANAGQLRVTQSGLAAITADPASVIDGIAGGTGGVLQFNAPASCGGSVPICCPGGTAQSPCGPIDIDLSSHPGDQPRLEIHPASGAARLDLVVRARVKTEMDIPVTIPVVGDCGVKIDTTPGATPDIQINAPIGFAPDATAGTTAISVGAVTISNLTSDDVALTGGFGCQIANFGLGSFLSILTDQITGAIQSAIQDQTCKACASGDVAECGSSFAATCNSGVCTEASGSCLQELGLDGRIRAGALFGSLSPGTTGALDLYEVAGGYATTDNNGLALGLLGGMLGGGQPRDRCGPPATPPAPVTIPQSAYFQGNTRPDTGAPFDIGIGLHVSQLAELAYAGYDGGFFCLTVGHNTVAELSTDTLSLVSRSLGKLVESSAPMAVGLRPQSPPVITLGSNTFTPNSNGGMTLTDPLLDLKFTALEIDFFVAVDDQWIRAFTVVSDVDLPIGLQVTGQGQLTPVLGSTDNAFTNVSVKNSSAVTETPDALAALFPSLLAVVLPQLSGGLSPISLPTLGGLTLNVTDVTAVDNTQFLAIYANLATVMAHQPVETRVALAEIDDVTADVRNDPRQWRGARTPSVTLSLGGSIGGASGASTEQRGALEWSVRVDDGSWSAWSSSPTQRISSRAFLLSGTHWLDARARRIGHPETLDDTPARVEVEFEPKVIQSLPFHGAPGGTAGCACNASGSPLTALPFGLVLLVVFLPRRARRAFARLGATVWLAALACLPGCSCGSKADDHPCGETVECQPGDIANGGYGRFTSIAADNSRVLVATYDTNLGDLVVVDATDPTALHAVAVDGIPTDVTPTHDPSSYRGGVEDAGPNVGAYTAIAVTGGLGRVAYQDRDAQALKFAFESEKDQWHSYALDTGNGEAVGAYSSITLDGDGKPAIAYLAIGKDDGMGHRVTELRLARGQTAAPGDENGWTMAVVASNPGTCAGLCAGSDACIADATSGVQTCTATTADCTTACATGQACIAAACVDAIPEPDVTDIPSGLGFPSIVTLGDGRLAVAYYDRNARSLVLAIESAAGSNQFAPTTLDGGASEDVGMWASAVVDSGGTVHVAYQDALGDQVLYTTWNGNPGTPVVVDDGERPNDRTHPVGAAAAVFLVQNAPMIAYQDGLDADVYLANPSGTAWQVTGVATGPLLDGFSVGGVGFNGSPVLAWGTITPGATPQNSLVVQKP
ncbi:MAG TPA: hypothetical protein VGM88_01760 [Kofleriaceae bacterium]|jgi:hypothetical protein